MKARNCTAEDLQKALLIVNTRYADNIRFRSLDVTAKNGRSCQFTLGVIDAKAPGHRRGYPQHPCSWKGETEMRPGKRMPYACWHVHGHFFEALFTVNPDAQVLSGISSLARPGETGWITRHGGNWQDRNIGSQAYPLMFSEACDCEE